MSSKLLILAAFLVLPFTSQAQVHNQLRKQHPATSLAESTSAINPSVRAAMKAEFVRWASSSATSSALEDMHINQMCLSSGSPCYDIQHFDENKKLLRFRRGNLAEMVSLRDHAKMNDAAAAFVNERIATKIAGLQKDRDYLIQLYEASMMDTDKHEITAELAKINAAISKSSPTSKSSAQPQSIK